MHNTHIFFSKNINVFAIFSDRNFNVMSDNNFVNFLTTGPRRQDKVGGRFSVFCINPIQINQK